MKFYFSTQWGIQGVEFSKEVTDSAHKTAIQRCGCGHDIIFFNHKWYDYEIDFEKNIYVPTTEHVKCKEKPDVPLFDYWHLAKDMSTFNKMRREVFMKHGNGADNIVSSWPSIDVDGKINTGGVFVSQEVASVLFEKYYKWWNKEHASFELDACEVCGCKTKGFHLSEEEDQTCITHRCPFSTGHWCKTSMTHCDCYTIKSGGFCIEGIIERVSKLEKPMEDIGFLSFVTGMLNFLKSKL